MSDSPHAAPLSHRALAAIGKNVLNFQRLEGMLKFLVSHSQFTCRYEDLPTLSNTLRQGVLNKTLGGVVGDFFKSVVKSPPQAADPELSSELPDDHQFAFSYQIGRSADEVAARENALKQVVNERNLLIHHQLLEFDPYSEDSCRELIAALDAQHERLMPVFKQVQKDASSLQDALANLGELYRIAREDAERLDRENQRALEDQ